ncbi:hypothetical protein [Corynebacterium halotolerans]|uniref:hypothetical protein n=1 Tax=Corynebacterium halotolerans TaxID=225326 RepID=UPI003CEE8AFE
MKLKLLSAVTLTTTALLGLAACGNQGQDATPNATPETSTTPATPAEPAAVALGGEDAPAGYTFSDIGAFLENQAVADENAGGTFDELYRVAEGTSTTPEHCGVLLPTAVDTLLTLHEHPTDAAAVDYVSEDNATIITVMATTAGSGLDDVVDPAECGQFTRTSQVGDSSRSVIYESVPREAMIEGADDVTATRLTTVGVSLDGEATVTPDVEESELSLSGTTDGIRFRIHASGPAEEQVIDDLARLQVDKIRNR